MIEMAVIYLKSSNRVSKKWYSTIIPMCRENSYCYIHIYIIIYIYIYIYIYILAYSTIVAHANNDYSPT